MPQDRQFILPEGSEETVARLGEVAALRAMTDTLNRMGNAMQGMMEEQKQVTAKLHEMHTDITVMKLQEKRIAELEVRMAKQEGETVAIKLVHASQEGGNKRMDNILKFSPLCITIFGMLFFLFKTGALKL